MSQQSPSRQPSPGGADQWVRPYTSIAPFEIPMISINILHLAFLLFERMLGSDLWVCPSRTASELQQQGLLRRHELRVFWRPGSDEV